MYVHDVAVHMSKITSLEELIDLVSPPTLEHGGIASVKVHRTKPPLADCQTDLDDDVLGQLIDADLLLLQPERLLELLLQLRDIPVDFAQPSQQEVSPPLGELVDGELLRRRAVDMIR